MGTPYVGEIRMFAGNFAPVGWLFCQGQLVGISEYDVLYNLIGTTYGGDGSTTFGLPNLQSRLPVHQGPQFNLGQTGGVPQVTLTTNQMPTHSHPANASRDSVSQGNPAGNVTGASPSIKIYKDGAPIGSMAAVVGMTGGNLAHNNMQPFQCINFIISVFGIYPPPS